MWQHFIKFIATGFGAGLSPKAPGTLGSLIGIAIVYLLKTSEFATSQPLIVFALSLLVCFVFTHLGEKALGLHDDPRIVIDEIAGIIITIYFFPFELLTVSIGFALFRLFDIWKPGPIGYIDAHWPGALGTFFDDFLAGICAAGCLWALTSFGLLSAL